jgi:diguanylate cyclase (GGDEF)-like protein/PAS domain S-box-containing protein
MATPVIPEGEEACTSIDELIILEHSLSLRLSATSDLEEALEQIMEAILSLESVDCCAIYLVNQEDKSLVLERHSNLSDDYTNNMGHFPADSPYARRVAQGKSLFFTRNDYPGDMEDHLNKENISTVVLIPFRDRTGIIGSLNCCSRTRDNFPETTRIYLESISGHLGAVISRIRTEDRVQESERLYRLLTEHSTDMISRHNAEGTYLFVSPVCRQILGYEPDELIGQNAYSFFHPDDIKKIQESHDSIRKDVNIATVQYRIRKKDGSYTWFETTSKTIREDGRIQEIISVSRDISERRRIYEELLASRELFQTLAEDLPGVVFQWHQSPGGERWFSYVSPRSRDYFEIEPGILLENWRALDLHPDDREPFIESVEQAIHNKEDWNFEGRFILPGERIKWWQGTATSIDTGSDDIMAVGVLFDITDSKEAELALQDSELRFRELAENIDEAFWLRNSDRIIYVSPAYERIWGYPREKLYEDPDYFISSIHPDDREWVKDEVMKNRSVEDAGFNHEYRIIRPDGEVRWVHARSFAVYDDDGTHLRNAGVAADITERKKAEQELERLARTDGLTGLSNRRYFRELVLREIDRSRRHKRGLSLLFMDIDHFKKVNDTYGHDAGDEVLRNVASLFREYIRSEDPVGRMGGEEFAVMLTETRREDAMRRAEHLRERVSAHKIVMDSVEIQVTISIGVIHDDGRMDLDEMMKKADRALYGAKEKGRNRVEEIV